MMSEIGRCGESRFRQINNFKVRIPYIFISPPNSTIWLYRAILFLGLGGGQGTNARVKKANRHRESNSGSMLFQLAKGTFNHPATFSEANRKNNSATITHEGSWVNNQVFLFNNILTD